MKIIMKEDKYLGGFGWKHYNDFRVFIMELKVMMRYVGDESNMRVSQRTLFTQRSNWCSSMIHILAADIFTE